jgi:hypothetical protein
MLLFLLSGCVLRSSSLMLMPDGDTTGQYSKCDWFGVEETVTYFVPGWQISSRTRFFDDSLFLCCEDEDAPVCREAKWLERDSK